MKKVKEFFKKQKNRFVSWYKETYYPVKCVILLLTLCFLVAFGLGSCSTKKPYKHASAAPLPDNNVQWITINYQPQFYYLTSIGTDVKLASDTQLIVRDGKLYYKFSKSELLLGSTSIDTSVYCYYYSNSDKVYKYSIIPIQIASTFNLDLLNKISEGSYYISDITFDNRIDPQHNYCFFDFRCDKVGGGDDRSLGAVLMTCATTVPDGYSFQLTTTPFFNYNIVTSATNSQLYNLGYQDGYNTGLSETLADITPWQILVQGIDSFFNAKIFGTISIGLLFELGLGVILFGFVIKLFYGG